MAEAGRSGNNGSWAGREARDAVRGSRKRGRNCRCWWRKRRAWLCRALHPVAQSALLVERKGRTVVQPPLLVARTALLVARRPRTVARTRLMVKRKGGLAEQASCMAVQATRMAVQWQLGFGRAIGGLGLGASRPRAWAAGLDWLEVHWLSGFVARRGSGTRWPEASGGWLGYQAGAASGSRPLVACSRSGDRLSRAKAIERRPVHGVGRSGAGR